MVSGFILYPSAFILSICAVLVIRSLVFVNPDRRELAWSCSEKSVTVNRDVPKKDEG